MDRASSPGTTVATLQDPTPPCGAVTGLPLELPFPSPHLISERQKLISLWHKLILMSPVPGDSSQTSRGPLQGRAGSGMTYGLAAPDAQLLLMAPDTSSPPKSAATEQPGELPSLILWLGWCPWQAPPRSGGTGCAEAGDFIQADSPPVSHWE